MHNVKIVNSLVLSQISVTAWCLQLYSTVCSSDNRSAENSVSIDLSLIRNRTFVHMTPVAENALSASTDDGGILSKYLYTNSRPRPHLPLDSNIAISLRMAASSDFSTSPEALVLGNHRLGQWCVNSEFHTLLKSKSLDCFLHSVSDALSSAVEHLCELGVLTPNCTFP